MLLVYIEHILSRCILCLLTPFFLLLFSHNRIHCIPTLQRPPTPFPTQPRPTPAPFFTVVITEPTNRPSPNPTPRRPETELPTTFEPTTIFPTGSSTTILPTTFLPSQEDTSSSTDDFSFLFNVGVAVDVP